MIDDLNFALSVLGENSLELKDHTLLFGICLKINPLILQ